MKTRLPDETPLIQYPCEWSYKVIGKDPEEIKAAIHEILGDASDYSISPSKESRSGKYLSYNVDTVVSDEETRNRYFMGLKAHSSIIMVL